MMHSGEKKKRIYFSSPLIFATFALMNKAKEIEKEMKELGSAEKREVLQRFFKTKKGQYGEGDKFLGVVVPMTRMVARKHKDANIEVIAELLQSEWHEVRLCALLIMTEQWKRADEKAKRAFYDCYMAHTDRINNWDLVDLSAPTIVGGYLADKPRDILYQMAESNWLWDNRIAMVATLAFIKNKDSDDTYRLALKMMNHKHDLMHKAIGWMLRESGKRDDARRLYCFVDEHRKEMPRTMLRYAIEKFSEAERKYLMRK